MKNYIINIIIHPTFRRKERKDGTHTTYSTISRWKHKNTRNRGQKGMYLVKTYKKSCQKLLTNPKGSDNICKHSSRVTLREQQKRILKKTWKKFRKSIDKRISDMIYSLSCLGRAAKIGPWKLNNEIRKGTRDSMVTNHQEEFLKVLFKQ